MALRIKYEPWDRDTELTRLSYDERNDCTVAALASAAGMPYREAHAILKKAGRKARKGFKLRLWLDNQCAIARMKGTTVRLGNYNVMRVRFLDYGSTITLAKFLRDFPKGRFLVRKAHHVFTVIDGRVSNLSTGARTRITDIWYFTEAV